MSDAPLQSEPVRDPSDAQLMAELATGDTRSLATLVERHQSRVLELAYRTTGDWSMAEDVAQEAFLRVWRSADTYRPQARFTTWLYRIVVNLCLDALRRRRKTAGDEAIARFEASDHPSQTAEQRDRAEAVRRAVSALPERQRVALVLYRFSDLPLQQVCEVTGWSASAVESLLVRAYAQLRTALKDTV